MHKPTSNSVAHCGRSSTKVIRRMSCCNSQDCYPTNIVLKEGKWWAQRREDLKWIMVPDGKLEHNQADPRESPDHQSHACISPPIGGDYLFCAVLGSGL